MKHDRNVETWLCGNPTRLNILMTNMRRLFVWPIVSTNIILVVILLFYTYQYYRLRDIIAIKKRRVKFIIISNFIFILLILRQSLVGILFDVQFNFTGILWEILTIWYVLNIEMCIWCTFLKYWMAYFDIQWTRACQRDQWKVS